MKEDKKKVFIRTLGCRMDAVVRYDRSVLKGYIPEILNASKACFVKEKVWEK